MVLFVACPGSGKTVVYDLAARTAVAERWSAREVILFGTPAAEPHEVDGFYQEAGGAEGDSFLWSRGEAEVSLTWPEVADRAAILDVVPYAGIKGQTVEVRLNGTPLGRLTLNDLRHRYRLALPAVAQRPRENRLRFAFARTMSPSDADPKNQDKRHLAAAFYSLAVGAAGDAALDDLLARDAPHPFSVGGQPPALVEVGPSVVRYTVKLPAGAELRFTPDLHPAARAAASSVSFRVTIEEKAGEEREVWSRVISPGDRRTGEVVVSLPGTTGGIVRLGLHVGGASGDRFAWGVWSAPRVLGRGGAEELEPVRRSQTDDARAQGLRHALAGSSVLFVILDAGRARQFGCYGYSRATTPEIDRIAHEGVVFDRAFTPAVYTLAAMSSVWTSQYPDRHHSEISAGLPKDRLTLADLLAARGVRTAGFVANAVAGAAFGFERGFADYQETHLEFGSGAGAFRRVVPPWLHANRDRRFFAYVHFREPHFPYDPPPPFDTRFGPDGPLPKPVRSDPKWIQDVNQGRRPLKPGELDHLVRLYDGNLAFADQELGEIRRALEAEGLWEKTVVVIAADHGEGMMDHGWIGHNVQVYDESARVPLIVRFPAGKGPAGVRIKGLADLLDVAPTIADVLGVLGQGGSAKAFQGRSLLPMVAGAPGKAAVLSRTVWDRPIYGLRDERFCFIYDTRTGEEKLFEVQADPGEARDVHLAQPIRTAYYREALHLWIAGLGRRTARPTEGPELPLSREQCEQLRSLGYLTSDTKCPEN